MPTVEKSVPELRGLLMVSSAPQWASPSSLSSNSRAVYDSCAPAVDLMVTQVMLLDYYDGNGWVGKGLNTNNLEIVVNKGVKFCLRIKTKVNIYLCLILVQSLVNKNLK